MPASRARLHAAALLGYVSVAVLFAWPLPLQLSSALPGPPGGDTGVYVWNLWVFRHEILRGHFPFFTTQILSANPSVPLTLHNYTTLANLAAFPLQPLIGTVATFNVLMIGSGVLAAYVMFLLLLRLTGDGGAAWIGGLLFGYSPFMTARQMAHFSLVQAAPLPAFALVLHRIRTDGPTMGRSIAAGAVMVWAFLSDPYYAVYCALMAAFLVAWAGVRVEVRPGSAPRPVRAALDVAIVAVAAVAATILVTGGGAVDLFGTRVSATRLYTPVLVLTLLVAARVWAALRPQVTLQPAAVRPFVPVAVVAGIVCLVLLAPLLAAMATHLGEEQWIAPPVWWRSSAPGVDLLAMLVPNPLGPLTGWTASGWLARMPDGLYENVASVPWVAIAAIVSAAGLAGVRYPAYWLTFTAGAAALALGPFVHVAGWNSHVPGPWALLRYLPVVGAARMPTRLTVLVMLGVAVLLAFAVKGLRGRGPGSRAVPLIVGGLLLVELLPAPRTLFPVQVPGFYARVAADERPVRVMHLPTGLRDGVSSIGGFSAQSQFFQVFHGKPLMGGYLSRLPRGGASRYERLPLMKALFELSEGKSVDPDLRQAALEQAPRFTRRMRLGYVIVHEDRASAELVSFAKAALNLQFAGTDAGQSLYIVR